MNNQWRKNEKELVSAKARSLSQDRRASLLSVVLITLGLRASSFAAGGDLDTTFDPGTGANNIVEAAALQSDGKIAIGGFFTSFNGTAVNRIARLNANGSLDMTFSPGTGPNSDVRAVVVQSDGKIIIGGAFTTVDSISRNHIARLNTDGSLDTSFNPGTGASALVSAAALQADGKSIIGGQFTSFNGTSRNRIARLNTDGSLDTSFDPGTGANNFVLATVLQTDGKVIIGGTFTTFNGTTRNRIARLNTNGSLDTSFDPGAGPNVQTEAITLQLDGKIIIVDNFTSFNGTTRNRVARLNSDGSLDTSFDPGLGANLDVKVAAVQIDGKIIIGGDLTSYNGTPRNRIARINTDGLLDTSFNPGTGVSSTVLASALQPDGKIIICGSFNTYNGVSRNKIARIEPGNSATWDLSPGSGDWNTGTNWTPVIAPNGPVDTATFSGSNTTGVSLSANTEVNGIVFNAGGSAFTITASPSFAFTISGVGITNNSGTTQNFVTAVDGAGNRGVIQLTNSAAAGTSTTFTNNAGAVSGALGGVTQFFGTSTASNCTLTNNGGTVGGAFGGETDFFNTSTAGNATLIANNPANLGGGVIKFVDDSTGGTARVEVLTKNSKLDIISHNAPGVTTGSIEGGGGVSLGARNLTVGTNNLSTTFSGQILDTGGGSLTKTGTGTLTLSRQNIYSGGTIINSGGLLVKNTSGSATGTGAVQVNAGTLGGTGRIGGTVTVGTGVGSGAFLSPGLTAATPGTVTILKALTCNADATYSFGLDSSTATADKVTAKGVTITNALFSFTDLGSGVLTLNTVFTVINNTATTPIAGTFSNLADGSTFTVNGNNYQVNYEGGDGNDLTLTVVP